MLDELARVMNLIRQFRCMVEKLIEEKKQQAAKGNEDRAKLDMVREVIMAILALLPPECVPKAGDGRSDLTRLEQAVTKLIEGVKGVSYE